MTMTAANIHIRVTIGSTVVRTVNDSVSVTEAIGDLTRVCEFELADRPYPEPDDGDTILVEWLDIDNELVYAMFGGTVDPRDVESEDWTYRVRAVDQLELLRRVRTTSDLDLTTLTVTEAVKAILDFCTVTYDDADISDVPYVLGEHEPVFWHGDGTTSGAAMIDEINRVFRTHLFTVGNNRVVYLPYDYLPDDATGLYRTYEKGVDIDFQAHHRTKGGRDRLRTSWVVRGVTEDTSASCSSTVWARSVQGTPTLGRGVRVGSEEFQSDFIQDEALAEAIVRSLMSQTSKLPDEGTATLENDVNVHPTSKIAIVDPTYGIDAAPRYFLVRGVNRSGLTMQLDLVAGPPGDEGTVTTGVDKVCTDVHTDTDWPGDFDWPDFDFPPIDLGDVLDFTIPDWDDPGFTPIGGELNVLPTLTGCTTDTYADAFSVEAAVWRLSGTVTISPNTERLKIGVTTDDGDYTLTIAGSGYYEGIPAEPALYEMTTPTQLRTAVGAVPIGVPIDWVLLWDHAAKTLYCQLSGVGITIDDYAIYPAATMATATTFSAVTGSPTRTSELIAHGCDPIGEGGGGGGFSCAVPLNGDWVIDAQAGISPITGDGSASCLDAVALHNTTVSVEGGDSWELRASVFASAENSVQIGVCSDGEAFQYILIVFGTDETSNGIQVSTLVDDQYDTTDQSGASVDCVMTYDADALTLTVTVGTVTLVASDVGAGVVGTLYPIVRIYDLETNALSSGAVTDMEFCVGGAGDPVAFDWTALDGSWTFGADDEAHNSDSAGADAYAAGHVFDGTERCRFTGHGDFNASTDALFSFIQNDAELGGGSTGDFSGIQVIIGASPAFYVYSWTGFEADLGTDFSVCTVGFDFLIDWNPDANLLSFLFTDSFDDSVLVSGAYALGTEANPMTVHLNQGGGAVIDWDLTNLELRVGP